MKQFELEEAWFLQLIKHLKGVLAIPLVTSAYPIVEAPCLYLEKNTGLFSFNGWSIDLIFHLFLDYEGDRDEARWTHTLRHLLSNSMEFHGDQAMPPSIAYFRETKMVRKNADKKVRQVTFSYQSLVQIRGG